jgi:hypothetical protein
MILYNRYDHFPWGFPVVFVPIIKPPDFMDENVLKIVTFFMLYRCVMSSAPCVSRKGYHVYRIEK